jgi:hypothetical protein
VLTSQVVIETAARLGITPAQAALQWLLNWPRTCCSSLGTGSVAHLRENWPPKASRSMTRRCAYWTLLHHGQTIRLERYEAMTTARDSERVRIAVVTGGAGARGRTPYRRPRPRRVRRLRSVVRGVHPGLRGRGAGALRALRRVRPLRRGIRPGDQHRRRRCDVAPCAGRQYRIGRARPGVRWWHGGTKVRAPQLPRARYCSFRGGR